MFSDTGVFIYFYSVFVYDCKRGHCRAEIEGFEAFLKLEAEIISI